MSAHKIVYPASPIKRHRATESEMDGRARFLIDYARQHAPVTVRQLYYQAEVAGLPGIEKTEAGYAKIQHQVLELRRQGLLSYGWIADSTRQQRRPYTSNNMANALQDAVYGYRRSLWQDADADVEIWIEKDALAGVVYQVTSKMDVPLTDARTICMTLGGHWHGSYGLAFCPVHKNTRTPALSLKNGDDGKLLVHCFAGCDGIYVLAALRAQGLLEGCSDWKPDPQKAAQRKAADEAERRRKIDQARRCWAEAGPIEETLAKKYF